MITREQKLNQINRGYMNGLSSEPEVAKALSDRFKQLAKEKPDSKWKNISEGFELGYAEQLKARKQELENVKSKGRSKGKSQGRSR